MVGLGVFSDECDAVEAGQWCGAGGLCFFVGRCGECESQGDGLVEWEGGFEEVLDECDSRFEESRGQGDWGGDVAACGFAVGFDGVGGGGGVGCGVDEVRAVVVVPVERGDAVGGAERGECGGFGVGRVDDDFGEVDAGRHEAFDVVGFEGRCFGGGAARGECKCSTYNDATRFESFDAFGGDISCDAVVHESVEVHGGAEESHAESGAA